MLVHVEGTHGPMARLLYGVLLTRRGRLTAVTNARVRGRHARHTAGTESVIVCFAGDEEMGTADCWLIGKAGLPKGNSVQSIFLKETRGKATIACRDGWASRLLKMAATDVLFPTSRKQPCTLACTLRLASFAAGCYCFHKVLACFKNFPGA